MLTFANTRKGKPSPIARETERGLGPQFGPDAGRSLIVSLERGDLIVFRPKGSRNGVASATAQDLYGYLVRRRALGA
jgi:hypothetical protein